MKMHFYVQPFILMFSHQYCIHSESRWTNFWNKSNSFIFLYFCTSRNSWTFHINYLGSDKYTDTGTRACENKSRKWNGVANILQFMNFFIAVVWYADVQISFDLVFVFFFGYFSIYFWYQCFFSSHVITTHKRTIANRSE